MFVGKRPITSTQTTQKGIKRKCQSPSIITRNYGSDCSDEGMNKII